MINQFINPGIGNGMNYMGMNNNIASPQTLTRITKEFQLCQQDNDLIQIGCNFGLENNNIMTWRVSMVGPANTPYEDGLFTLNIIFPNDYPSHGPEFRFKNKMYHLNVNSKENDPEFGHVCLSSVNSWRVSGQVKGSFYTVKQALFDIFCIIKELMLLLMSKWQNYFWKILKLLIMKQKDGLRNLLVPYKKTIFQIS